MSIRKQYDSDLEALRVALVEMGGVEPPSESALTGNSPGAGGYCGIAANSLRIRQAVTPYGRVASLCMVRSKLCALTDAAK